MTAGLTTVAVAVTVGYLTISGSFSGSAANGAASSVSVQVNLDANKVLAGLAALGLQGVRSPGSANSGPRYATDCAANATGEVKEFLTRHPCKDYAARTWTVSGRGVRTQVATSWVAMPTGDLATQYKMWADAPGGGNPPGEPPLAFNGLCYASHQDGATVWAEQVQPTGNASLDQQILQAAAPVNLSPAYVVQHCTS